MPPRIPVPHLVILLPGFMGSVLRDQNQDLWSLSGKALSRALRSMGSSLDHLALHTADLACQVPDDGIMATRLIEELYDIPNLIKGAGYSTLQRLQGHILKIGAMLVAARKVALC